MNLDGKVQELKKIIAEGPTKTWTEFDEIIPGLYLGGGDTAQDVPNLINLGVTHVLNATETSIDKSPCNRMIGSGIETSAQYYQEGGLQCKFLNLPALDYPLFELKNYFHPAAEFIHLALESGGKVYVHCFMGKSRSATLVMAYLIMKKRLKSVEAVSIVRERRTVTNPNEGFLTQLCEFEVELGAGAE